RLHAVAGKSTKPTQRLGRSDSDQRLSGKKSRQRRYAKYLATHTKSAGGTGGSLYLFSTGVEGFPGSVGRASRGSRRVAAKRTARLLRDHHQADLPGQSAGGRLGRPA